MAFHETFWAVTGAAGPVLGLAAVVSISDLAKFQGNVGDMRTELEQARPTLATEPEIAAAKAVGKLRNLTPYFNRLERRTAELRHESRIVSVLLYLQAVNVLSQAGLLGVSLWAIETQQSHLFGPLLSGIIAVAGLVVLGPAGVAAAGFRSLRKRFERDIDLLLGDEDS